MSTNKFSLADMAVSDMGTFTTAVALMPGNTHTKPYPHEAKNMMIEVVEVYKKNGGNENDKVAAAEAMKVYSSWVNQNPHMDKPKKATLRDMLSNAKLTVVVSDDGQKELCYGPRRYPSVEQLYEVAVPCLNRHLESGMKLFTKFETVNLLLFRNIRAELCLDRFEVNNEVLRLLAASFAERLIATNSSEPPRPSTDVSSFAVMPRSITPATSMIPNPPAPLPPGLNSGHQEQVQQLQAQYQAQIQAQFPGMPVVAPLSLTFQSYQGTVNQNTYKAKTQTFNNMKADDSESESDSEDENDDENVENRKPTHKKKKSVVFADSDVAKISRDLDELKNDNKEIKEKLDDIKTPLKSQSDFSTPVRNNGSSTGLAPTALFQKPDLYSSDHLLAKFVVVEKEKQQDVRNTNQDVSNQDQLDAKDQLKAIAFVREELDRGKEHLPAVIVAYNNDNLRELFQASLGGGPGRVIGNRVVIYDDSIIFMTKNDLFDEDDPYEGKDIDKAQRANDPHPDLSSFFESFVIKALGFRYKNSMEATLPDGDVVITFANTKSHFQLEAAISAFADRVALVDGLKGVTLVSDVLDGAGTFSITNDALRALASIPTFKLGFRQVTLSQEHQQRLTTSLATLEFDCCHGTRQFRVLLEDSNTFEGRAHNPPLKLEFKGDPAVNDSIGKIPFKFSNVISAVERGNIASLFLKDFELRHKEELYDLEKLFKVAQAKGVKLKLRNTSLKHDVTWAHRNIMSFLNGDEKEISDLKEAALGSKVREGERAQKELIESRKGKSTTSQSTVAKQTSKESAETVPKDTHKETTNETRKESDAENGQETAKDTGKDPDTKTSTGTQENSATDTQEKAETIEFNRRTIIDGKVQVETAKGSGKYRDCTNCVAAKNGWQKCANHKTWYQEYSRSTNANL